MLNNFILNVTIISSFLFLGAYYHNEVRTTPSNKNKKILFSSFSLGVLGIVLMNFSYEAAHNVFVDFRHIPLILSAVYGGIIPALITSLFLAIGRIALFGLYSESIIVAVITILIGVCNGYMYYLPLSKLKKFHLMNILNVLLVFFISLYLIGDYNQVISYFPLYAIFAIIGGMFTFAASEYIVKSARATKKLENTAAELTRSEAELIQANKKLLEYSNALHESEQRYKSLFDYNHDVSYMLKKDGTILNINKAAERITGYTRTDLIGKKFKDFIVEEDIPVILKNYEHVLQGEAVYFEARLRHNLGNLVQLAVTGVPKIIDDEIAGVIGTAKDITLERKMLEKIKASEERYRSLIELSPEAVVAHRDGVIKFINKVGIQRLGYSAEELFNQSIYNIIGFHKEPTIRLRIQMLEEGKEISPIELQVKRRDGEIRDVEASSRILKHQGESEVLTIIRDITDRKKIEKKLNEELELAKAVQRGVLSKPIKNADFKVESFYLPSEGLSGDMYGWYQINEHKYGVILFDVMGHGVSAALVSMSVRSLLRNLIVQGTDPQIVITEINDHLIQLYKENSEKVNTFLTAIYMVVDTKNQEIQYVNAGHPDGILFEKEENNFDYLDKGSIPLGFFENITFNVEKVYYHGPTRLLLYTDGYFENKDLSLSLGRNQLKQVMKDYKDQDHQNIIDYFQNEADQMEERPDDVCIIVIDLPKIEE